MYKYKAKETYFLRYFALTVIPHFQFPYFPLEGLNCVAIDKFGIQNGKTRFPPFFPYSSRQLFFHNISQQFFVSCICRVYLNSTDNRQKAVVFVGST